jgi:hypothetical protein
MSLRYLGRLADDLESTANRSYRAAKKFRESKSYVGVNKKRVYPPAFEIRDQIPRAKFGSPSPRKTTGDKRIQPKTQKAGIDVSSIIGRKRPVGLAGVRLQAAIDQEPGLFSKEPAERALAIRRVRERVAEQASRGEGDDGGGGGIAGWTGRTLQTLARQSYGAATSLPGAFANFGRLGADAAITAAPGRIPPSVRKRSAAKVTGFVEETALYPARFGVRFAKDPIGTTENDPLGVVTFVPAAFNMAGRGLVVAGRGVGAAGRVGADIKSAPSVRAGVARSQARVRSERAEARRATMTPDQEAAYRRISMMADPYGAPKAREFKFDSRTEQAQRKRRAAEVTGNRVGGRVFDVTQRIDDWVSDSYMPGSRRFRDGELIAPPSTVVDGDKVAPVRVRRRPRSSNPLRREIQIITDKRVRPAVRKALEPVREAIPFVPSAYDSAVRREARNRGYEVSETTDRDVMAAAGEFSRLIRQLQGSGRKSGMPESEVAQGSAAAAIRLMGLNDPAGFGSRTGGRDLLLQNMRRRADELDKAKPVVTNRDRRKWSRERKGIEENIRTLESIPDEWLDPETAPKLINDLVEQEQKISRQASQEKINLGILTPSAAEWSDTRAQAQMLGARPASRVRAETSAPYRRDLAEARAIREEIERREQGGALTRTQSIRETFNQQARGVTTPRLRFRGYTTEALRTMERARMRRASTIRGRVRPYIREAESDALRPYESYQAAAREAERLKQELRRLSSRRDGSAFDAPIEAAKRDLERAVRQAEFERDRAAARLRMAQQGSRAMRESGRRRAVRQRAAALRQQRKDRMDAAFELERAQARLRMARQGRIAMSRAEIARLERSVAALRRDAAGKRAPTVTTELGTVYRAGQRSGRAEGRAAIGSRPGQRPTATQSRAFGTLLRSDGMVFVARNRQAAAAQASEALSAGRGAVAGARGRRRVRTAAEERALRDVAAARQRQAVLRAQPRPPRAPSSAKGRERTPAEELAARQLGEARGNLRGTPREATAAERRRQRLIGSQAQDRRRSVGSTAQISAATREAARAEQRARAERERALRTAYTGFDRPEQAGMTPGFYYPIRPNVTDRPAVRVVETGGANASGGARLAPPPEQFNAGVQMERGDIDFSPQQIINMLRESIDARERSAAAADIVTRFAMRDANGRLITGDAARELARLNEGFVETISMRQLARISSLSADREAGRTLIRDLENAIFDNADSVVAIPTAVRKGWVDALGKQNVVVRNIEYLNSLWKGGVLALNPRWYLQNFFGMWGQFLVGAGADLQAISMARNVKYLETIPGRIAANGLASDLGEYARRMQGRGGNPYQRLVQGGFRLNSLLEGPPRLAMFWSAAKRGLRQNDFMERGVMNEAYLARAWADVVEGAKRGDPGAEAILDDVILVTERFMGNYSRYNAFEKNFMRLVFPFYGWQRAIHRLVFGLPFTHPKRAALLVMASQMAYEDYELNRNRLTAPRSGVFIGNRMFGTSTWNPVMSVTETLGLEAEVGSDIANANWRNPGTYFDVPFMIATDVLRSGFQQAGPLVSIPYRAVSGETPSGIPDRFSPGYDRRWARPTGGFTGVDALTGGESNAPPRRGFFSTLEQSFPIINNLRRAAAGGGTPVADANLANLGLWAAGGRRPKDAPYNVVNDPRQPSVVQTDALSALSNLLLGVPADRVDWNAAEIREAQALENFMKSLESAESRKQEGIAQQRARKKKGRRP